MFRLKCFSGTLFAATITLLAALPAVAEPVPQQLAEGAVVVNALTAQERGTGAGTIVAVTGDRVRVLTARHVAVFGRLVVQLPGGAAYPASIVLVVPGHDVAVIEATVPPAIAAGLRAAPLGAARQHETVHVWGSGLDGPAFEPASVAAAGGAMPDGPANGRIALTCDLCHRGDSGAGVFDSSGALVGIFVGYYTYDTGERVGVAEIPAEALRIAAATPYTGSLVASTSSL